jgi:hypothetical protein
MKADMRFRILRRDGFRCVYCGCAPGDAELHVDHRILRERGGTDDPDNLTTACSLCNLGKGTQSAEEPMPPPVLRVSAMSAAHLRRALLAAIQGPMGCRLTFCAQCDEFCTISSACEPPCCYRCHGAVEVVP